LLSISLSFLASLYEGAVLLFTTGRTRVPGLWNFSCAFSVGGVWVFCVMYLMCCLGIIWLHCCAVFWIRIWSLLVGLFGRVWKLLSVRKVCTFLVYSCLYMITVALLLSARVIIAFSFASLWLMFFSIYCCLLYVLWLVLYICVSFLAAIMRNALCSLVSSSPMAFSVSRMRLVQYFLMVVGCFTAVQDQEVLVLLW